MDEFKDAIKKTLETKSGKVFYYSLKELEKKYESISRMPYSVKVLLESVVRQLDGELVTEEHINNVINWRKDPGKEIPFKLARVIFQDFTPRLSEIHHFFL